MTNFEIIGGEETLRSIITDFYQRVFADPMIGYLFAASQMEELIDREVEFTARMMGAPLTYTGRTMRQAHAGHRILSGHFNRRHRLLEMVLEDHRVPTSVRDDWLSHMLSLRSAVLGTKVNDTRCDKPNESKNGGVEKH